LKEIFTYKIGVIILLSDRAACSHIHGRYEQQH